MGAVVIGYRDRVAAATLGGGSWNASFPLNNIKDKDVNKPARSSNAAIGSTQFRADLGANYIIRALNIAKHNLSESAKVRWRLGTAALDVDYTSGDGTAPGVGYAGATNGTVVNDNGVVVPMTQPRLDHDPSKYKNGFLQSADLTQTAWGVKSGLSVLDAETVDFSGSGSQLGQAIGNGLELQNASYTISGEAQVVSGNGEFQFRVNTGTPVVSATQTATAEWTRFSATLATGAASFVSGTGRAGIIKTTSGGIIRFRNLQIEYGTNATEYRSTTTSRIYQRIGRLCEPARTNLALRSGEFGDAAWTKTGASIGSGSTRPDNSPTASRLVEDSANNLHRAQQAVTITANAHISASVWVKAAVGTRHLQLLVADGGVNGFFIAVDVTNRSVGAASTTGTGTLEAGSAKVQMFPNGWMRVSVGGKVDAASTTATMYLSMQQTVGGPTTYTGDGSSALDLWGAQIEASNGTSSYIPTAATTVTRTIDTASLPDGVDVNVGTTEGTLYVAMIPGDSFITSVGAVTTEVGVTDGTANNRVRIRFISSATQPTTDVIVDNGGSVTWDSGNINIAEGVETRAAVAYRANDFAFHASGGSPLTNTSLAVPPGLNTINLDLAITRPCWKTREAYWDRRLTDTQLAALVTSGPGASGVGYDSGWVDALQMKFAGEVPATWGKQYNVSAIAPAATIARYLNVQIDDTGNTDGYVSIGQCVAMNGIQPTNNASVRGYQDRREDYSSYVVSETGTKLGTQRDQQRRAAMTFPVMTQAEANEVHQIQAIVGTLGDVVFVPDPDDAAMTQEYGGLGTLGQLSPIDYLTLDMRDTGVEWWEKM